MIVLGSMVIAFILSQVFIVWLLSVPSDEDVRRAGWTKSLRGRTRTWK